MKNQTSIYYQAIKDRDPHFDGVFFFGVKTTGIYCRPICPARPQKKNIEFFKSAVLAEKAGYRACLRCRPETTPHSPAWIGKSAIVQRALRRIRQGKRQALNEEQFAEIFGVSARHLRRLFQEELGKTPKQVFDDLRLSSAQKMLLETKQPIIEIALSAGYLSLRRFNDAFKLKFKLSPSKFRKESL